jgi:hypothetical protein
MFLTLCLSYDLTDVSRAPCTLASVPSPFQVSPASYEHHGKKVEKLQREARDMDWMQIRPKSSRATTGNTRATAS